MDHLENLILHFVCLLLQLVLLVLWHKFFGPQLSTSSKL